eukprot:gene5038-5400_t
MFFYLLIIISVYGSFGAIHLTRNTSNHDFKELSLSYIPGKDKLLEGSCPDFKQFQIQDFDISLYDGVWYELGVKDFLQFPEFHLFDCFKLDFQHNAVNATAGIVTYYPKGYEPTIGHLTFKPQGQKNTFSEVSWKLLGHLNNVIFKVYTKIVDGKVIYDRAIQFQCKVFEGFVIYPAFYFLTRNPIFDEVEYTEMLHDVMQSPLSAYADGIERFQMSCLLRDHSEEL